MLKNLFAQISLLKSLIKINIEINIVPTPDTKYTEKCTVLINAAIVFLAYYNLFPISFLLVTYYNLVTSNLLTIDVATSS